MQIKNQKPLFILLLAPMIMSLARIIVWSGSKKMDDLADLYRRKLDLPNATFTYIDHEDAMVAAVFKIVQPKSSDLILKICSRKGDFLRESYFLSRFAGKLPVPWISVILYDFFTSCEIK